MAIRLSKTLVERSRPADRRVEVPDAVVPGLYLVVNPTGRKTYAVRCRVAGKSAKITVGPASAFDLDEARERAREVLRRVARGEDPRAAGRTFRDLAEEWLRRDQAKNRGAAAVAAAFERDVYPRVGDLTADQVDRRAVRELVARVVDRGSPVAARRLQSFVHRMFKWCVGVDLLDRNPIAGMPKPGSETSRQRVLTDAELAEAWRACDALGDPFGAIVRLLVLTGARRGEVAGLTWGEVDLDGALIRLGGDRTKNGLPHDVPLSEPALVILRSRPRLGDVVFTTNGETASSGFSRAKRRLDRLVRVDGAPVPHFTLHDLRRTVATGLQRLGARLEVIEAVLNHVSGSRRGVVGVYQRHAFDVEKRAALDDWARHVVTLTGLQPRPESRQPERVPGDPGTVGSPQAGRRPAATAGRTDMKPKKKFAPSAAKTAAGRVETKPAGAAIKPLREGGTGAKVLKLMDGKMTFAEIGQRLGISGSYARAWATQAHARKGIGFRVGADGKVAAFFPKGKTIKDAIVKA